MGEYQRQHHEAMDGLIGLLNGANLDLTSIHLKLEKEFRQLYPDQANPMKLVNRIKKIEEDVAVLKVQCRELLAAKQDLIDKARTTLVGNKTLIQRMQASLDIPVTNFDEDPAFSNFNQIIDEWTAHVSSRTVDEQDNGSDSKDINKLLFSAIVESN